MEFDNAAVRGGYASATQPYSRETVETTAEISATAPDGFKVIRRNGKVTTFDGNKIKVALTKAFLAVEGSSAAASTRIHQRVDELSDQIVYAITRRMPVGGATHIEDIQDHVELVLVRARGLAASGSASGRGRHSRHHVLLLHQRRLAATRGAAMRRRQV